MDIILRDRILWRITSDNKSHEISCVMAKYSITLRNLIKRDSVISFSVCFDRKNILNMKWHMEILHLSDNNSCDA